MGKIGDSQGRQTDCPGAAPGLGVLDLGLVAVWMGHGPANMYGSTFRVNVGPLQSQHFLQAEGVQGLDRQIGPVCGVLNVPDMLDQVAHLPDGVGGRGLAGLAGDFDTFGP